MKFSKYKKHERDKNVTKESKKMKKIYIWKALQGVPINGAQSIFKETISQQSIG